MPNPIFISYSHEDHAIAERLARALMEQGQEVWWDQWEIAAGDSIIRKIFAEGVAKAGAFVILLSPTSVRSKWVQEELDAATVRRIEDLTRVIPALVQDVPLPIALRTLRWVDLNKDFGAAVRLIINAVNGVSEKPGIGLPPLHIATTLPAIAGLSRLTTSVARHLLSQSDSDSAGERALTGTDLTEALHLRPEEVNDAVDELEDAGLVTAVKALGTAPFDFVAIEPTYLLYHTAEDQLAYSPSADVNTVVAAVASLGSADGKKLQQITNLSPGRLNRAVDFMRDNGLAEVIRFLGTYPYSFGIVEATRQTRQAATQL